MWQRQDSNPICWQQWPRFPHSVLLFNMAPDIALPSSVPGPWHRRVISSASFLSAQQHITKHLLFHLVPIVTSYHVNKPSRFSQKPQMWKLLSPLILIQGVRICRPLNMGCSLMDLWRRFNLTQNNIFNCDHAALGQTLNTEEPNLLWDFPPCSAAKVCTITATE